MRASERLAWAADVVDPAPGERILEVGCGHGVLVSLLADRLTTGVVVGVDRSAAMIAAAARRNQEAMEAGRVRLRAVALADADLAEVFDVVVSFDVRAFWTPPAPEWDVVRQVLAPEGRALVAYRLPDEAAHPLIESTVRTLAGARSLALVAVHRARTTPTGSVALELRERPPARELSRASVQRGARRRSQLGSSSSSSSSGPPNPTTLSMPGDRTPHSISREVSSSGLMS